MCMLEFTVQLHKIISKHTYREEHTETQLSKTARWCLKYVEENKRAKGKWEWLISRPSLP